VAEYQLSALVFFLQ